MSAEVPAEVSAPETQATSDGHPGPDAGQFPEIVESHLEDSHEGSRSIDPAMADSFRSSLSTANSGFVNDAIEWLSTTDVTGFVGQHVAPTHGYDVRGFMDGLPEGDEGPVTVFLNQMADAGASQSDVEAALAWYSDLIAHTEAVHAEDARSHVEAVQQIERDDIADTESALAILRERWGLELEGNIGVLAEYLASLPGDERDAIEQGRLPSGVGKLNDVDFIVDLFSKAHASVATTGLGGEKTELERLMADKHSDYWRGPSAARLQSRYRALLDGTAAPATTPLHTTQLAELEALMADKNSRYWRGADAEALQQRYRTLIDRGAR